MEFDSALTRRQVLDRLRHGTRQMQRRAAAAGEMESRPTREGFVLAWAPGPRKLRGLCLIAAVEDKKDGCVIRARFGPDPHTARLLRCAAALVWVAVLAASLTAPDPGKALCTAAAALLAATALVWLTATQLPKLLCPAARAHTVRFVQQNLLK